MNSEPNTLTIANTATAPPPAPVAVTPTVQVGTTVDMSPRAPGASLPGAPRKPYVYDVNPPLIPSSAPLESETGLIDLLNIPTNGVVVMPDGRTLTTAQADAEDDAKMLAAAQRTQMPMPSTAPPASRPVSAPLVAPSISSAPPVAITAPVPKSPRRSPFRFDKNFCAGAMSIDMTQYFYRELLDGEQAWLRERFEWMAGQLGITVEKFLADDYEGAIVAELNKLPQHIEETFDILLGDCGCLRAWDWDEVPVTPENVRALAFEVKAQLFQQISRSTQLGVTQESFSTRP